MLADKYYRAKLVSCKTSGSKHVGLDFDQRQRRSYVVEINYLDEPYLADGSGGSVPSLIMGPSYTTPSPSFMAKQWPSLLYSAEGRPRTALAVTGTQRQSTELTVSWVWEGHKCTY